MDQLSVCTFNILAPAYKELDNGDVESRQPELWVPRHTQIIELLLAIKPRPTVLILQEFWVDPKFQALYTDPKSGLCQYYNYCFVQRTGRKLDGVAVFTLRRPTNSAKSHDASNAATAASSATDAKSAATPAVAAASSDSANDRGSGWIEMIGSSPNAIHFRDVGNRIAVLLHARFHFRTRKPATNAAATAATATASAASALTAAGANGTSSGGDETVWCHSDVLICGTHLTFPHHEHDIKLRLKQIECTVRVIHAFVKARHLSGIATILAGDLNSNGPQSDDNVTKRLMSADYGFVNSFQVCNKRTDPFTHLTHRGDVLGVDFIWFTRPQPPANAATGSGDAKSTAKPASAASSSYGIPSAKDLFALGLTEVTTAIPPVASQAATGAAAASPFLTFEPVSSVVLPANLPDSVWPAPHIWPLSDHRPVFTVFDPVLPLTTAATATSATAAASASASAAKSKI